MMNAISNDDVRRLAQLSNIQLSDAETESLKVDVANILTYIDTLGELNTAGVEPTYQLNSLQNVTRADKVESGAVKREHLLALAPESINNQVKVPKVL